MLQLDSPADALLDAMYGVTAFCDRNHNRILGVVHLMGGEGLCALRTV
jgi:hypothetical protein